MELGVENILLAELRDILVIAHSCVTRIMIHIRYICGHLEYLRGRLVANTEQKIHENTISHSAINLLRDGSSSAID